MVVYERVAEDNWGGWTPDITGGVGAGDSLEQVRKSVREGVEIMLGDAKERGLSLPEALSRSVDFSEFDPDPVSSHYVVEWMTIELPETGTRIEELSGQAA